MHRTGVPGRRRLPLAAWLCLVIVLIVLLPRVGVVATRAGGYERKQG
jgi:hypothetical protein